MKSKRKIAITSIMLFMIVGIYIKFIYLDSNSTFHFSIYKELESDKKSIENVVEPFISNSFNFGISDFDTSLIDPKSDVYIKFFKLRNEYRRYTLSIVGYNKSNIEHISKSFNYSKCKMKENSAYVQVSEIYETHYKKDHSIGTGQFNYEIILRKLDGKWMIHACISDDDITNKYDASVTLDQLVDHSLVDINRKNKATLDIEKLNDTVRKYWEDSTNEPLNMNFDI